MLIGCANCGISPFLRERKQNKNRDPHNDPPVGPSCVVSLALALELQEDKAAVVFANVLAKVFPLSPCASSSTASQQVLGKCLTISINKTDGCQMLPRIPSASRSLRPNRQR
jgi:hypothetical protein